MKSQSLIGVYLLILADRKPEIIAQCLEEVTALASRGEVQPRVGARFTVDEIAAAHEHLENRASTGKVVVCWGDSTAPSR